MKKGEVVIYIDHNGKTHDAMIIAVRPMFKCGRCGLVSVQMTLEDCRGKYKPHRPKELIDTPMLTLSYPDATGVKVVDSVVHQSHPSKNESNPDLPRYVLNAWKRTDEGHVALPADHPHFDHPFAAYPAGGQLPRPPVSRPRHDEQLRRHQAGSDPVAVPEGEVRKTAYDRP